MDWYRLLPQYWIQADSTDYDWDKTLNELLDKHEIYYYNGFVARIGRARIWTTNWPFAYGSLVDDDLNDLSGLPKVATRKRLKAKLKRRTIDKVYNGLV
jgi:hypothetical protein